MMRASILIPNFNHGKTIGPLLSRLETHRLPCLIVNDGSDPETREALEREESQRDWVKTLHLPEQRGKGGAVLAGLLRLREDGFTHALQMDADGQHDPADVPRFLQCSSLEPKALVLGRPVYGSDAPRARVWGRQISRFWVWVETISFDIGDPILGYRVYPIEAALAVARENRLGRGMDFDPEIAVRLHWAGTPIRNVETRILYPPGGVSHFRLWMDNAQISWLHTRLFFGMLVRLPRLLTQARG